VLCTPLINHVNRFADGVITRQATMLWRHFPGAIDKPPWRIREHRRKATGASEFEKLGAWIHHFGRSAITRSILLKAAFRHRRVLS
jgi:hypothetical protein